MNAKQPVSILALAVGLALCSVAQANEASSVNASAEALGTMGAASLADQTTTQIPSSAASELLPHAQSAASTLLAQPATLIALANTSTVTLNEVSAAAVPPVVDRVTPLKTEQLTTSQAAQLDPASVASTTVVATNTPPEANASKLDSIQTTTDETAREAVVNETADEVDEFADPYERTNRKIYTFNDTVDKAAVKPLAKGYQKIIPEGPRLCASNMFSNLGEPYTAVNNLLQGKPKAMFQDIGRLLINSTLGIGGCVDVASQWGIPKHHEDFGQTLAVWGVPSGPYVVLPVLGPSTVRDALSKPVDFLANPIGYITHVPLRNSLQGYKMLNTRSNLLEATDTLEESALDPYVMVRDAWLQRRLAQIKDEDGGYEQTNPSEGTPRQLEIAPRSAVIQ